MNKKVDEKTREKLLEVIQKKIGNNKLFKLWFASIEFYEDEEGNIYIPVKTSFKEYFENNFKNIIKESIKEIKKGNCNIYILCQSSINWGTESCKEKRGSASYAISFSLNKNYTFENFIVGNHNRLAYTLVKNVADNPLDTLSPTFIYGAIGLGKTHLLHAMLASIMHSHPNLRCLYISCEGFVNTYVDAIRKNKLEEFRSFIRNIDVLAIDDIHFLSHKEACQEEFFHTFNALYNSKKQIVLSSDCSPKEITAIKEQLISRFLWGRIACIEAPDYETKLAIVKYKAEKLHLKLTEQCAHILASTIVSNIRELEGVLNTIKSYSQTSPVTDESLKEILNKFIPQRKRYYTPSEIMDVICTHFNITIRDLKSEKRYKSLSIARQLLIYLLKQYTLMNLSDIGALLGGRNHSTIIYACNKISKLLTTDERIKNILKNVETMLKNKIHSSF
ncbi:MAG: chromosomal replication initiator protein DnaA [Planctomycetota bacterium]